MNRTRTTFVALVAVILTSATGATLEVGAAATRPVPLSGSAHTTQTANVTRTMQALAKLQSYGYRWTTDDGALKAIKAWQRANGLDDDGIVGPLTSASLELSESVARTGNGAVGGVGVVPSTPAAPTMSPPVDPRSASAGGGTVEQMIRDIWPDELEDHAIDIAFRESRLQSGVRNACCYGLFQIHWKAHHSWLAGLGVVSADQLLDAQTNARAAYALYQRVDAANGDQGNGWGPWALG